MPANPAQLDKAERLEWPGRVYSLCYDEKLNTHWDKGKGEDTGHAELDLNGSTTFSGVCQCSTGHVHTVDSMKEQMEREKRKKMQREKEEYDVRNRDNVCFSILSIFFLSLSLQWCTHPNKQVLEDETLYIM